MKRIITTIALLFAVLWGSLPGFWADMFNVSAQTNRLSIGDVTFPAGKTTIVPVSLENQSDICGVQFEIGLPYELIGGLDSMITLDQTRAGDMNMVVRSRGKNYIQYTYNGQTSSSPYYVYRVIITSATNAPIKGSSGTLVNIRMPLPENVANGTVMKAVISDETAILSDRQGNNVRTGDAAVGTVTIKTIPRPDIVPLSPTIVQAIAGPGDELTLQWQVKNVGDSITGGGWTERLYLENEDGTRANIGTTAYNQKLAAGATVSRKYAVKLSDFPGISGNCRAVVQLLPSATCGEVKVNQVNNTASGSSYSLRIKKKLVLTPYKNLIPENGRSSYSCELRRTGDISESQTFTITTRDLNGNTGRLKVGNDNSQKVTFSPKSDKTYIHLYPIDNSDINTDQRVLVVVNEPLNNGYECVVDTVRVEDDDLIPMTLSLNKSDFNEGDIIHVTASVPQRYYPEEDLNVYLTIEQPKRFRMPQRIHFEKDATTASVDIPVLQDKLPSNDMSIQLIGTSDKHKSDTVLFMLHDDDMPVIDMKLTPKTVSEGAGPQAMMGTITRKDVTDNKVTIRLSDDGNGDIYYSVKEITMQPGTITATFPLGVRDNAIVDGDRKVAIRAAVYVTDCGCDAIGDKQSSVVDTITITDDDGPALQLTANKATILEGDATGATMTVSRNTTDNTSAVTVSISHDGTDVECPTSVTIPAGERSTTFKYVAQSNSTAEGDRTVSITVTADGYSTGAAWLLISDRTIADATFSNIQLSDSVVAAGDEVVVTMAINNIGAAELPTGTDVQVFLNNKVVNTQQTSAAIPAGESLTLTANVKTSDVPGTYTLSAKVNPKNTVPELLYVNNSSETLNLRLTSLYTFTVSADKAIYNEGNTVTLSGQVTANGTASVANLLVEPYIVYNGTRTKLNCLTDATGAFSAIYELPAGYRGHFVYGACNSGEELQDEMGAFNVYGFERTSISYLKHEIYKDEPYKGTIEMRNMSSLALHNIKATLEGATTNYNLEVSAIDELVGNGTATIDYTITGTAVSTGSNWDVITLKFTSDEGAKLDVATYNYTRVHTPKMVASTTSINTTVTKGINRTYPIEIVNMGLAETGKITIDLPSGLNGFIGLATPATMSSLQPGDTATIMLRFADNGYDVNIIQKGSLAVNCENGNGLNVSFNVKVVSESKGALRVRVRDENTIYGNKDGQKPYVKDAKVQLRDYNTGAVVASGTTPDDTSNGLLLTDINEGYYTLYVTADKHDSYRQNIVVSPGDTTEHTATCSYQAVSVSWDVEETEVEDEYEIVTTVVYETQVPVPVVRMTMPDTIAFDKILYGHSTMFNIVLRNDGLIAANECNVTLPSGIRGYEMTPLKPIDNFTIGANQSYIIPVRITRTAENVQFGGTAPGESSEAKAYRPRRASGTGFVPCVISCATKYKWLCAEVMKSMATSTNAKTTSGNTKTGCSGTGTGSNGSTGFGEEVGGPGGGGYIYIASSSGSGVYASGGANFKCSEDPCDPLPCATQFIPHYDCVASSYQLGKSAGYLLTGNYESAKSNGKDAALSGLHCLISFVPILGKLDGMLSCYEGLSGCVPIPAAKGNNFSDESKEAPVVKRAVVINNYVTIILINLKIYKKYLQWLREMLVEKYDAPTMLDNTNDEIAMSLELVEGRIFELYDEGKLLTMKPMEEIPEVETETEKDPYGVLPLMPNRKATYYDFDVRKYLQRCANNYKKHLNETSSSAKHNTQHRTIALDNEDNVADFDMANTLSLQLDSVNTEIFDAGYANIQELVTASNEARLNYLEEESSSNTCAHVKLEIEQKLVLTRQAFRGTLTIDNAMSEELKDVQIDVIISNMLGEQATSHEFQTIFEKTEGFEGTAEGPWTLAPKTKGMATILFIPTKYAAPDTLTTWSFGGNLSWKDNDSTYQQRSLYPVSLQVKPSPELDLTYFMQRDIYGDNPLTPDVVEPVIPAEFTVLIHNKGKGDATNVRMMTKQPKIVENEKGLMVDFAIVASSLNGGAKTMALDSLIATPFGDIKAGESAYATWDLTSSLLGHFIDYDVSVTHLTSYGNPDLSLLDQVTIHELIHSVNATFGDSIYRAWITNDVADKDDAPDHIYFSNGTDEDLQMLSDATKIEKLGNSKWRITVNVPQRAWYYTSMANPTGGTAKIVSITRETDGAFLDADNFWTTQYTIRDNNDPLPDNKLHIVDYAGSPSAVSYIVEFEPVPDLRLDITSIGTVPEADKIAEKPIDMLTVTFNKPIDPSTFTRKDIVVRYEGVKQDVDIPISMVENDSVFKLNTSALAANGYYILQVGTDSIRDKENFWGANGKQVKWMLFKDGLIHYNVAPWPSVAGSVDAETTIGDAKYGTMLSFTAKPAEGYDFSRWALYSEEVSSMSAADNGSSAAKRRTPLADTKIDENLLTHYSDDATITVEMNKAYNLYAVFKPKNHKVDIVLPEAVGNISVGSGFYNHGTILNMKATAYDGYSITGFIIDGDTVSTSDTYSFTVSGDICIVVAYKDLSTKSVILQDTKDYTPVAVELANVILQRTFRKDTWNTICLPCDVEDPQAVFGTGTKVARLTGMDGSSMKFNIVNKMEANIPYLIKPGSINDSRFADKSSQTIVSYIQGTSVVKPGDEGPIDKTGEYIDFIGTYTSRKLTPGAGIYYISNDLIYYVDAAANVPSGRFRGYFRTNIQGLAKVMGLAIDEEVVSSVDNVSIVRKLDGAVYTLSGLMVLPAGSESKDLRALPSGIYIVNGKKLIVTGK